MSIRNEDVDVEASETKKDGEVTINCSLTIRSICFIDQEGIVRKLVADSRGNLVTDGTWAAVSMPKGRHADGTPLI